MKTTTKILLLTFAAILLTVACEKDKCGNRVKYYKHVTGEGYVFYRYLDGSIDSFLTPLFIRFLTKKESTYFMTRQ